MKPLSEELLEKIKTHIESLKLNACPVCNNNSFGIDQYPGFVPMGISVLSARHGCIVRNCMKCGNFNFFRIGNFPFHNEIRAEIEEPNE